MKHEKFEEQIIDHLEGNLSAKETKELLAHAKDCPACSKALEQYKSLDETFSKQEQAEPSPLMKMEFRAMLEREKSHQKEVRQLSEPWKRAFQVAASLLLLFMGYAIGEKRASSKASDQFAQLEIMAEDLKKERTLAMLENRSASKRIQAVNYSEEMPQPEEQVLTAIIERFHYDENVNVRLAAAEALTRFENNRLIRDAFLHSLKTEKNPEVQIAVIQFLVKVTEKRAKEPMEDLLREPEVPIFVKQQLDQGIKQII